MSHICRTIAAAGFLFALILIASTALAAQLSQAPSELTDSVNLDQADSAVRAHLERVKAYVADRQWDEAVETLRQVMETQGAKMVPLSRTRYVNLADFAQLQIASLPEEGLALYRQRVDPLAEQWYADGVARRDAAQLAELVEKMFCSSVGDSALLALGEMELERGHHGMARHYWERLIEVPPTRVAASRFEAARRELAPEDAELIDAWYAPDVPDSPKWYDLRAGQSLSDEAAARLVKFWKSRGYPFTRLSYPGTKIPLADVRARLVMTSIMEGSLARAADELRAFTALHADAEGRLAGRSGKYVHVLAELLESAKSWPSEQVSSDWPTFAGSYERTKVVPRSLDLAGQAWSPIRFGEPLAADGANARTFSLRRVGEDATRLLSYHPVVTGELVLWNNQNQIFAVNRRTGQPAWPAPDNGRPPGEIFNGELPGTPPARPGNRGLGAPRFTMTVHENKVFARMGSPVTSRPLEALEGRTGYLVCLDLAAEGRLLWRLPDKSMPEDQKWAFDEKWSFEGSPVVSGPDVYVAMRKSDVRPQSHVACFDVETRRLRWRTMVCAAETPGAGQVDEITHNLLTLDQGVIYANTNLGAVAAISARDGRLRWATLYPRARKASSDGQDKRAAHYYRDLNPCVYQGGRLLVAPADCASIFALDAASGELLWESQLPEDAVHLLGVGHGNLLASGDWLWWIDARQGKVVRRWPDTTPLGYGRGILMGDQVVWPTRDALYVFDQEVKGPARTLRDPIPLAEGRNSGGGNLVSAGDVLLIATADQLFAFRQTGSDTQSPTSPVAARPAKP